MLRPALLFVLFILLNSCNTDEVKLIRSYQVDWETNLMERYSLYEPPPAMIPFFRYVFINPDGRIYIIHVPEDHSDISTITLLNENGAFLNHVILDDEYVFGVSKNAQGFMQTLARSGDNYLIKTWDENLNTTATKVLPQPNYFHQIFIWENFYYEIRFDFEFGSFTISKYSLNDVLQWSKPFSGYKITGYATPVFFTNSDDFVLSRHNMSYDSLRAVKVSGQSGLAVWSRSFSLSEIGTPAGSLPAVFPGADGQVWMFSKFNYRVLSSNGFTLFAGRLKNTSSIPESWITAAIKEPDNGYLIATRFLPEEGWEGFRLLKTDSRFNVGWVGTFHQAVSGYLTGWARHNDTVVLLTSNGYVYAIKPAE